MCYFSQLFQFVVMKVNKGTAFLSLVAVTSLMSEVVVVVVMGGWLLWTLFHETRIRD